VHGRLRKSEEALRQTLAENPERMKTVFRQRAVRLAQSRELNRPASQRIPALIFRLAQERYAVALNVLAEVLPFKGCTQVPGAPPKIAGAINLRGTIRPVIDLALVLSGNSSLSGISSGSGNSSGDSGVLLVLRQSAVLKVDRVEELREIRSDELAPPVRGQHCQAVASGPLALLNVESLLSTVFSAVESRSP
jgi:chemotaxis signal transduction protein